MQATTESQIKTPAADLRNKPKVDHPAHNLPKPKAQEFPNLISNLGSQLRHGLKSDVYQIVVGYYSHGVFISNTLVFVAAPTEKNARLQAEKIANKCIISDSQFYAETIMVNPLNLDTALADGWLTEKQHSLFKANLNYLNLFKSANQLGWELHSDDDNYTELRMSIIEKDRLDGVSAQTILLGLNIPKYDNDFFISATTLFDSEKSNNKQRHNYLRFDDEFNVINPDLSGALTLENLLSASDILKSTMELTGSHLNHLIYLK